MIKIILVCLFMFSIFIIYWFVTNKVKIKFNTFLKKGFAPKRGNFGLYVYDGKQGKGKTYSLVEYLIDHNGSIKTFSNVSGIKNVDDISYFVGFDGLIKLKHDIDSGKIKTNKQLVIIYDEIFTELQKYSKLNKEVIDFLCQMRKRKIIFLTTAQEWAEIPLTFRRFCRYEIKCNMINFCGIGLLFKEFHDAENMKWSDEQQEHVAPLIEMTLTKCRRYIADSYDTFLRISSAAPLCVADENKETIKEESKIDITILGGE